MIAMCLAMVSGRIPVLLAQNVAPESSPFYTQSSVANTSQYNPLPPFVAPMSHYCVLVGSILLLVISLFLFTQSIELQRFAFRGIEDAPNPQTGSAMVWLSVIAVVLILGGLSYFEYVQKYPGEGPFPMKEGEKMHEFLYRLLFFHQPLSTVPAFTLASLLPSALAAYKFMIVRTIGRGRDATEGGMRISIGSALIGVCVAIINFAASIATLISFSGKFR